jgi:transposase-like protein
MRQHGINIKYTTKKECPYCKSSDVSPTGSGHGQTKIIETGGNIPKITNFRFKCDKCKKEFYYCGIKG